MKIVRKLTATGRYKEKILLNDSMPSYCSVTRPDKYVRLDAYSEAGEKLEIHITPEEARRIAALVDSGHFD